MSVGGLCALRVRHRRERAPPLSRTAVELYICVGAWLSRTVLLFKPDTLFHISETTLLLPAGTAAPELSPLACGRHPPRPAPCGRALGGGTGRATAASQPSRTAQAHLRSVTRGRASIEGTIRRQRHPPRHAAPSSPSSPPGSHRLLHRGRRSRPAHPHSRRCPSRRRPPRSAPSARA